MRLAYYVMAFAGVCCGAYAPMPDELSHYSADYPADYPADCPADSPADCPASAEELALTDDALRVEGFVNTTVPGTKRALVDETLTRVFKTLKRSGLINDVLRMSLTDESVRESIVAVTVELIDAEVIPYEEIFDALVDSGLALDVVRFALTDEDTRDGLVQLIVDLIPELLESEALRDVEIPFCDGGNDNDNDNDQHVEMPFSSVPLATPSPLAPPGNFTMPRPSIRTGALASFIHDVEDLFN